MDMGMQSLRRQILFILHFLKTYKFLFIIDDTTINVSNNLTSIKCQLTCNWHIIVRNTNIFDKHYLY